MVLAAAAAPQGVLPADHVSRARRVYEPGNFADPGCAEDRRGPAETLRAQRSFPGDLYGPRPRQVQPGVAKGPARRRTPPARPDARRFCFAADRQRLEKKRTWDPAPGARAFYRPAHLHARRRAR